MRKLLFLLLTVVLSDCTTDDMNPDPAIENIVDKWRLIAYKQEVDGANVWVDQPASTSYSISFRFDGVILDKTGLPNCCAPNEYYLNGVLFKVIPKAKLKENPACAYTSCPANVGPWNIVQNGNELVINDLKFIRE